jgi:hypothetical protein
MANGRNWGYIGPWPGKQNGNPRYMVWRVTLNSRAKRDLFTPAAIGKGKFTPQFLESEKRKIETKFFTCQFEKSMFRLTPPRNHPSVMRSQFGQEEVLRCVHVTSLSSSAAAQTQNTAPQTIRVNGTKLFNFRQRLRIPATRHQRESRIQSRGSRCVALL